MASGSDSPASSGLPGVAEISLVMRKTTTSTTETGTETGTAATVARARPVVKSRGTDGSKQTSSRPMPKHRHRWREPSGPRRVPIGGAQRSGSNGRSVRWTMPASPVARASLRPSRREAAHPLLLPRSKSKSRSRRLGCAACSRLGAAARHPHTRARGEERPLGSVGTGRCSLRHFRSARGLSCTLPLASRTCHLSRRCISESIKVSPRGPWLARVNPRIFVISCNIYGKYIYSCTVQPKTSQFNYLPDLYFTRVHHTG